MVVDRRRTDPARLVDRDTSKTCLTTRFLRDRSRELTKSFERWRRVPKDRATMSRKRRCCVGTVVLIHGLNITTCWAVSSFTTTVTTHDITSQNAQQSLAGVNACRLGVAMVAGDRILKSGMNTCQAEWKCRQRHGGQKGNYAGLCLRICKNP